MRSTTIGFAARAAFICLGLLLATPLPASAAGPSFDCSKATADDEVKICNNDKLSELDGLMNDGFQSLKAQRGRKAANAIARPLLAARQSCGSDVDCIMRRQIEAVQTYRKLGAAVNLPDWTSKAEAAPTGGPMPKRLGACVESTITLIGGRLEGDTDFESGTGVMFANGGTQISYDKEQAIIDSKVGDPVNICLTSIPKDCPPGDERGKEYRTTNLRTGKSWELSDSQHMCGGA